MLDVHSMKLQSCSQKADYQLQPKSRLSAAAYGHGTPEVLSSSMRHAGRQREAAGTCPFGGDSEAEALHPQQVGMCMTALARLTALPLLGKPFWHHSNVAYKRTTLC